MSALQGRLWIRPVLLVSIVALLAAAWLAYEKQDTPRAVTVVSPSPRDVSNLVTTNGTVEPITEFQARANFPGIVEQVAVSLGDNVAPGQLLVAMKDPFAEARVATARGEVAGSIEANQNVQQGGSQEERNAINADLARAKAAQDEARHSLDLMQQLQTQGAASEGEVEAARKRLADTTVTFEEVQGRATRRFSDVAQKAALARLADAKAALAAANTGFNNAHITSPIAGTVYSVSVSPYDFVNMGADLLRITDLRQMQIRAYFDEPEVGRLKEGQEVTVTWDARPGMLWHGHIRKAPVAAMPQGDRSVAECLIQLDDSNGVLLPNTHVTVTVSIEKHLHVLTVPRQALQTRGPDTWVYRVLDGKLVQTPVRVGLVSLDLVEIVSGLSPNDVVAVNSTTGQPLADRLSVKAVH